MNFCLVELVKTYYETTEIAFEADSGHCLRQRKNHFFCPMNPGAACIRLKQSYCIHHCPFIRKSDPLVENNKLSAGY